MYDVLRMGRKAFTVSVVVATIAWSIGLAALLMPLAAGAATLSSGDLIKASLPAVYYYGADGKRYVFPNEKTYFTWYSDFSSVKKITDAELAAISIGGNVTYKPGVKMVKITTDPKVYAVDAGGTLRWINSENVAGLLYGGNWNQMVDDVSDAFFVNYKTGADIAQGSDYVKATVLAAATSINVDKGLLSQDGGTGTLTIAADAANWPAASIVDDSSTAATDTDSGQQRAPMLKVKFSSNGGDVKVTGLKFKRGGISKDGDVDNVLLMEGKDVLAEAVSTSNAVTTFSASAGLFTVPAGGSKVIDVVLNLNKGTSSGSTINLSLASADVTSNAANVSGSAVGNSMTVASVEDLGQLEIGQTNTAPASVDPGTLAKEMWRVSFNALSQDLLLTYVKFTNLGSSYDSDIQNLKLMDAATQLNGTVAQVVNKEVVFDLTNMTGGGYKILAGQNKQLTLNGDIVGGTNRNYKWTIQKEEDVRVKDLEYGVETYVDDYDATKDNTFGVVTQDTSNTDNSTTINTGTLSVGVATESPSTNVPDEGAGVTLAIFDFKASGEDVKITDLTVICQASTATRALKNTLIKLDGVQVGSTDSSATCGSSTSVATYSFGNSMILTAGVTHKVSIVADLNASASGEAWTTDDTFYVGFGGTAVAQGKSSLTSITPSNINGRTLSIKTGTVTVSKDASFSDRTSTFPTGVSNTSNAHLASFVVTAGSGEAVDVNQIVLYDPATYCLGRNFQNLVLKERSSGSQVGTAISSLNGATSCGASSYTFSPATSIRIEAGAQKAFDVYADVKGSPTDTGTAYTGVGVSTVSATGVNTGASANYGTAGQLNVNLQKFYLAANGQLTIDESADTAVAQQLVLGSTGVSLAKFKLSANAAEDIVITELVVSDDVSTGCSACITRGATGTLKNLKLYKGSTLLAGVDTLDNTNNATNPIATFNGFSLTVPKNENVTIEIKGDLTTYTDGGITSSTHRIFVPVDAQSGATINLPVVAKGAGSGQTISYGANVTDLIIAGGTAAGTAIATLNNVVGSYMDTVRAKLTLAHAADTPSGAANISSEQTVAKFVATNSANVGNYALTIKGMNFAVSSSGASLAANSAFKVYKDSISTSNQLASSNYTYTSGVGCTPTTCGDFFNTNIDSGDFTDANVDAGTSKTLIVTLDTSSSGLASNETLSVGIAANDLYWNDGVSDYYTVDTLPLTGKTLVY